MLLRQCRVFVLIGCWLLLLLGLKNLHIHFDLREQPLLVRLVIGPVVYGSFESIELLLERSIVHQFEDLRLVSVSQWLDAVTLGRGITCLIIVLGFLLNIDLRSCSSLFEFFKGLQLGVVVHLLIKHHAVGPCLIAKHLQLLLIESSVLRLSTLEVQRVVVRVP